MKIISKIIEYPDINEIIIWEPNENQAKYMQMVQKVDMAVTEAIQYHVFLFSYLRIELLNQAL